MSTRSAISLGLIFSFALSWGCEADDGGTCKTDTECKGDRICEGGVCMDPGMASGSGGGESAGTGLAPSCEETNTYCQDNILYDCVTDEMIVNCRTCQYVGPGTGSEYDTTCKAQMSDCSTCDAENPWNGPGCYFGGGPAVCK